MYGETVTLFYTQVNSYLGVTEQHIELNNEYAATLHNKSSNGRLGLFVTCEANWVDPGFRGKLTMEMFNASKEKIKLQPGCKIGQLIFHKLLTPAKDLYKGHYQDQTGPTVSKGIQR